MAGLLGFGTLGYRLTEGWPWLDGLYMTVITIATVGFSEVRPLSLHGRVFTMVLIFAGLIVVSLIGTYCARLVIDAGISNVLGGRCMSRQIARLKAHYVVCGFGRIGSIVCDQLHRAAVDFVIIEKDQACVQAAEQEGYLVVRGDATSDAILRQAGIERARGVIAVLNSDADNLFISLAAREINPAIKIIARGEEPGIENRLVRAGADVVVSPLKLGGLQIARIVLEGHQDAREDLYAVVRQATGGI